MIKYLFLLFSISISAQTITEARNLYEKSNGKNTAEINNFYTKMQSVQKTDNKVLVAYKGASSMLKAGSSTKIADKKKYSKEGVEWIEYAITNAPNDIEIRFIRLSIQENTPKIVGYNTKIQEDKKFIIKNFSSQSSILKNYMLKYIKTSKSFTEEEKKQLK